MANMSYCAIENTAPDLEQCLDMLNEQEVCDFGEYELKSLMGLLSTCRIITENFDTPEFHEKIEEALQKHKP